MASGMGLDDAVVEEFTKMKLKKKSKIMTFKIELTKIKIDETCTTGDIETLKSVLPGKECRYAVYDNDRKIHFIMWTPEEAHVRDKMTYSASKEAIHKHLDGVTPVAFEAHDKSDFDEMLGTA
eukprot:GHVS01013687.1.p1 GENE.GHVS01013687.1~~GHVS01013687.1.p1  ORF type:complete len:123 (+),score=23.38 GHVS01013687.1:239-607(+)